MKMTINDIIAALPSLSQAELEQVRAAVDHLTIGHVDAQDVTLPLYETMTRLIGVHSHFRAFHGTTAYKTWRRTAPHVITFIEKTFPQIGRVAKSAVMTFLLEALIEDLKERGIPITPGRVTLHLERLPQIFEAEFPGYIESGLAHLVLEQMLKKRR